MCRDDDGGLSDLLDTGGNGAVKTTIARFAASGASWWIWASGRTNRAPFPLHRKRRKNGTRCIMNNAGFAVLPSHAGVDEAGRGCLVGSVFAAAVILSWRILICAV